MSAPARLVFLSFLGLAGALVLAVAFSSCASDRLGADLQSLLEVAQRKGEFVARQSDLDTRVGQRDRIVNEVIEGRLAFHEALTRFRALPDRDEFVREVREKQFWLWRPGEVLSDEQVLRRNLLVRLRQRLLQDGSDEALTLLRRLEAEAEEQRE